MEEPLSPELIEIEETIQIIDKETMSQFISRTRNETEHHKLHHTERQPKDKQNETKLESIGMIRKSNKNSSKKNDSKMKENTKINLSALSEATEGNIVF